MKYYLSSEDLYIEIIASVFNQIRLQAEGEYPNENGGMLAGRYSADRHTVYIEKVVVPMEKLTEADRQDDIYMQHQGTGKSLESISQGGIEICG